MEPVRFVLDRGRRYELSVVNVGLACCAVEFVAASLNGSGVLRRGAGGTGTAHVLVVSGTVTAKGGPSVVRMYEELPEPRYVLSFGACASSGGPYWDSYAVTNGVDRLLPVDVYVPGCPPRPEALLQGLLQLQDRIAGVPVAAPAGVQDLR